MKSSTGGIGEEQDGCLDVEVEVEVEEISVLGSGGQSDGSKPSTSMVGPYTDTSDIHSTSKDMDSSNLVLGGESEPQRVLLACTTSPENQTRDSYSFPRTFERRLSIAVRQRQVVNSHLDLHASSKEVFSFREMGRKSWRMRVLLLRDPLDLFMSRTMGD